MKYSNEVVGILEEYKDVQATQGNIHWPKDFNTEDKKSEAKVHIQNQRIKMYVTKEMDIVNNIDSIYENITPIT